MNKLAVASGLVMMLFATSADAGIFNNGDDVNVQYLFPTNGSIYDNANVVVGPGVEVTGFGGPASADLSTDTIVFGFSFSSFWNPAPFNGFRFFDYTNTLPSITGVVINPSTNMAGFGLGNITFDADNIYINWQGLPFTTDTIVSLSIQSAAVPEPASMLAWGLIVGAGAVGYRLRRRTAAAA